MLLETVSIPRKTDLGIDCSNSFSSIQTLSSIFKAKVPCFMQKESFLHRAWKVLPPASYLMHRLLSFFFPFYRIRFSSDLRALDLIQESLEGGRSKPFSLQEKEKIASFLAKTLQKSDHLQGVRAVANHLQVKTLEKILALSNSLDESYLSEKLDRALLFLEDPTTPITALTARELGVLHFALKRLEQVQLLQSLGAEGLESLETFWKKMVELGNHPIVQELKRRSQELLKEPCLAFALSREDSGKFLLNLEEEYFQFLGWVPSLVYLFIGNPVHVGFLYSEKEESFFSHITRRGVHDIVPNRNDILYPAMYLFRWDIRPLLDDCVTQEDAVHLQHLFLQTLQRLASHPLEGLKVEGVFAAVQTFFLGLKTPFWDRSSIGTIQPKEFCTGVTAKTVHQAVLKMIPHLEALGYCKESIRLPFKESDHIGRMSIVDFLEYFAKSGMMFPAEDPLVKALVQPGCLESYMPSSFFQNQRSL
jgi:hypothetical protein